jgi:hypothetical protein
MWAVGEELPKQNSRSAAYYANGDHASCHAPLNYFRHPPTPANWQDVVSFRSRLRAEHISVSPTGRCTSSASP